MLKYRTSVKKTLSLYFNLCLCVKVDSLSCSFTAMSFLADSDDKARYFDAMEFWFFFAYFYLHIRIKII